MSDARSQRIAELIEICGELYETNEKLRAENQKFRSALELMAKVERCDCGCNMNKPILMRPSDYYVIAKNTLQEPAT